MRKPVAVKVIALMAKGHSYLWRAPGRRDEERRRFAALMRRVEKIRVREGLTKRALAAEIGASEDGLHSWISGRSETVARIKEFLERKRGSVTAKNSVIKIPQFFFFGMTIRHFSMFLQISKYC
jgi:hypothetical protein